MTPEQMAALRALAEQRQSADRCVETECPSLGQPRCSSCRCKREGDAITRDYIAAASAASAAAAAVLALLDEVGGWQPIATAPDDGSYVLLWDRNVGLLQGWQERDGKWCHAWDGEYIPRPEALTHWRPEPKGPRA